jgi:hypothetical protein
MHNKAFFIAISILAMLVLAACDSAPSQPAILTPTATSIPSPASQQPTPTLASNQSSTQQLFVSISSTTTQNSSSISVHTLPGAAITIDLAYCGHTSKQTYYADSAGDYTLNWAPDTKCGGTATATVTASANGQTSTSSTSFSVS